MVHVALPTFLYYLPLFDPFRFVFMLTSISSITSTSSSSSSSSWFFFFCSLDSSSVFDYCHSSAKKLCVLFFVIFFSFFFISYSFFVFRSLSKSSKTSCQSLPFLNEDMLKSQLRTSRVILLVHIIHIKYIYYI